MASELRIRFQYRVVVMKSSQPMGPHERVIAIAIDENLVGRGKNLQEALGDLARTYDASQAHQAENVLPPPKSDPDPELERAFSDRTVTELDGDLVLGRGTVFQELPVRPKTRATPHDLVFAPCTV